MAPRWRSAALVVLCGCGPGRTAVTATDATSDGSEAPTTVDDLTGPASETTASDPDTTAGDSGTTGATASCGDGVREGLEHCDDGNDTPGDGCEPGCLLGSGAQIWSAELDGGDDDVAHDLLITAAGDIVVVGSRRSATGLDTWVAVLDPAGQLLDERTLDLGEGDDDECFAIAPLGAGYVFAGVASIDGDQDVDDALLVATDAAFATQWSRRIDGGFDESAADVVTTDALVAVTGHSETATTREDAWFAVYDLAGAEQWSRAEDGPDAGNDEGRGIAWTADGGLVVVGAHTVGFETDLWISARDPDGTERWSELLDFDFGDDYAAAVAVADGDIWVTGSIASALTNSEEVWLGHYDAAGTQQGTNTWNSGGFVFDGGEDLAVAADAVFVAGITAATDEQRNALVGRWPPAGGAPLWTATFDGGAGLADEAHAVATLGDGSVVAAGEITVLGQGTDAWIRRWAP